MSIGAVVSQLLAEVLARRRIAIYRDCVPRGALRLRRAGRATSPRVGGPQLGALHPVADAVGVVLFEVTGAVLAPARRRGP